MRPAGKMVKAILRNQNGSIGKEYTTDKVILGVSKAVDKIIQNFAVGRKYRCNAVSGLTPEWVNSCWTKCREGVSARSTSLSRPASRTALGNGQRCTCINYADTHRKGKYPTGKAKGNSALPI